MQQSLAELLTKVENKENLKDPQKALFDILKINSYFLLNKYLLQNKKKKFKCLISVISGIWLTKSKMTKKIMLYLKSSQILCTL